MAEDAQNEPVSNPQKTDRPRDPLRLYVRNLPFSTKSDDLKEHFAEHNVTEVDIKRGGYGFIAFESEENASQAKEKHDGTDFGGRKLIIDFALKKRTPEELEAAFSAPKSNLYIKELEESITKEEISEVFSAFGEISSVNLFNNKEGGQFAFIKFVSLESAQKAHDEVSDIKGKKTTVEYARYEMPRRGRGGFRRGGFRGRGRGGNFGSFRPQDKKRLYVSGLDSSTTEEFLQVKFEPYGEIEKIEIAREPESNRPKGFAFIVFSTEEGADLALEKTKDLKIDEKDIIVERARLRSRAPRGRGSFRGFRFRGRGRGRGFRGRGRGRGFRGRGRGRGRNRNREDKNNDRNNDNTNDKTEQNTENVEEPNQEVDEGGWGAEGDQPEWGQEQ